MKAKRALPKLRHQKKQMVIYRNRFRELIPNFSPWLKVLKHKRTKLKNQKASTKIRINKFKNISSKLKIINLWFCLSNKNLNLFLKRKQRNCSWNQPIKALAQRNLSKRMLNNCRKKINKYRVQQRENKSRVNKKKKI